MGVLSSFSVRQFKSRLSVSLGSVWSSREKLRDRLEKLRCQKSALEEQHQRVLNENRALKNTLQRTEVKLGDVRGRLEKLHSQPVHLPDDPPLKNHQFGPRMIAFCCSLCSIVGFRSTERVLPLIGQWLNVEFDVPARWTMRLWSSRNGVAILQQSAVHADDWIWLIDHSVQLGKMCVLVVLGIRQADLPVGRALQRQDMKPLAVLPTTTRNKEEVGAALLKLAAQIGSPISVVLDGATELCEGVKYFERKGFDVVTMNDIKHKAANILKKRIGKEKRFTDFEAHVGKTTACIQQTELDHFLAPKKKTKCRFMNLGKLIDWADMVLFHLKNPSAAGNIGIPPERLTEKLGWLLEFEDELEQWRECRKVVSTVLQFTNRQGVYIGSTDDIKQRLAKSKVSCPATQQVLDELVEVCAENEKNLATSSYASLRLINSTEVLESSLGSFKALQRHHNRGTFTTLLAVFPTLFQTTTPNAIRKRFSTVLTKDLKQWTKDAGLSNSTQARKTAAYNDSKKHSRQKNTFT